MYGTELLSQFSRARDQNALERFSLEIGRDQSERGNPTVDMEAPLSEKFFLHVAARPVRRLRRRDHMAGAAQVIRALAIAVVLVLCGCAGTRRGAEKAAEDYEPKFPYGFEGNATVKKKDLIEAAKIELGSFETQRAQGGRPRRRRLRHAPRVAPRGVCAREGDGPPGAVA